jgi:hypothetical protein
MLFAFAFPLLEISVAFLHTAAGKGLDDVGQDMARANAIACVAQVCSPGGQT